MKTQQYVDSSFQEATRELLSFVSTIPPDAYQYRPEGIEDAWTIQEHLIHLLDSEINAYLRLKSIVATPGIEVPGIDEAAWVKAGSAHREDVERSMHLLELLRDTEYHFLSGLDYEETKDRFVVHPGEEHLDISTWVDWYSSAHFDFHKKLMVRNLELWSRSIAGEV